jgi:FixJ family two-component response regulator
VANLPSISVVDDDDSIRESLRGFIRSIGFSAKIFASAEEFLNSEDLYNTDCLILDVRMPGMGGLDLQRRLIVSRREIPVIFVTAHGDEESRSQALRNGAFGFLIKPFSEDALLNAIHAALDSNDGRTNDGRTKDSRNSGKNEPGEMMHSGLKE